MISAEFFDIFRFMGFIILFIIGISIRKIPGAKVQSWIIIAISLLGMIVDGFIVLKNFIL